MNQKRKNSLLTISLITGIILGTGLFLTGLAMMIFHVETAFPNSGSAPYGFLLLGALLLFLSPCLWAAARYKTRQQEIEERDERNVAILHKSCFYAYFFCIIPGYFGLLFLALLGYLNRVSFLTFAVIFLLSTAVMLISDLYFKRKM